jgi:hypothetical protein
VAVPRENVSPHELKLRQKKTAAPSENAFVPERHGDRDSGDDDDDGRYLSTARVAQRYDVTTRTIERWEEDEHERLDFPEPDLRINHRKYWKLKTLERWERRRATASNT